MEGKSKPSHLEAESVSLVKNSSREYAEQALEKLGSGFSEADVADMIKAAIAPAA